MDVPKIIEQNGQRVLTTAQLAEAYETSKSTINRNFERNKTRYQEGKHYYRLSGEALKAFKNSATTCRLPKTIQSITLWTERGALLHAKSLNTDKAWEVYDFLVEHYFRSVTMEDLMDMTAEQMLENAKAHSKNKNRKQIAELRKYHELHFDAELARAKASLAQIKMLDYLEQHPTLLEAVDIPMLEKTS